MESLHSAGGHYGQRGVYRPFCKWLCLLGAFYALLNKVSLFQMRHSQMRLLRRLRKGL